jgi:hypothetical protein
VLGEAVIPAIIGAVGGMGATALTLFNNRRIASVDGKVNQVHVLVNSNMTAMRKELRDAIDEISKLKDSNKDKDMALAALPVVVSDPIQITGSVTLVTPVVPAQSSETSQTPVEPTPSVLLLPPTPSHPLETPDL